VAECFPEDFAITFNQPHLRDMAMDKRSFTVRGRVFVLRPWFPAARGVHRVWRWYCRVALDNLPLEALLSMLRALAVVCSSFGRATAFL
jgi:hypothetical protein